MSNSGQRILVVGPSWLGDMVLAQSLFSCLKREEPDVAIDVTAPAWSFPVLARMPEVDQAIEVPVPHGKVGLGTRWRIGRSLRRNNYDRAIVLPRSFKSALVPFFAGVPHRIGYRGEFRYLLINEVRPRDAKRRTPIAVSFVSLGTGSASTELAELSRPKLDVDEANRRRLVETFGLSTDRPIVGCMPGAAYGPAKAWPLEYYGDLARRLSDSGRQIWILGSDREHEAGEKIRHISGDRTINLCGRTGLADVVDLLSLTRQVVTNDSGLMHVAAAVGIEVIAIYGSSTPAFTPPMTDRRHVFHLGLECSPCFARKCRFGHYRCLTEIGVDQVYEAMTADYMRS